MFNTTPYAKKLTIRGIAKEVRHHRRFDERDQKHLIGSPKPRSWIPSLESGIDLTQPKRA